MDQILVKEVMDFKIQSQFPKIYACELTLDPKTAHRNLSLSEDNRKVTVVKERRLCSGQPERFEYWKQLLCGNSLTGRCYWEVQRQGGVHIGAAYSGIRRKTEDAEGALGSNDKSWSLYCSDESFTAWHKKTTTDIRVPPFFDTSRVAVYLDWPAGTLSFYTVTPDTLIHLHTFRSKFTEPLYPAFGFGLAAGYSVSLCQLEE
ncbi:stonustoxin subunit beta-like [Myripristis murdjan]|uniref:stonustoxin subunit beta-like n=1 Tax=Myripristis murdjan TaxID=586833 RepID=UPI001175EFA5|nr:stonustoxin subunit beta-like [Myripristis murdjan]